MTSCVREVERRGINEVGIYRVSGSASDVSRLKKAFETSKFVFFCKTFCEEYVLASEHVFELSLSVFRQYVLYQGILCRYELYNS